MGKYFIKHLVAVEIEGDLDSPGTVDRQEQSPVWQLSGEARHASPEKQWGTGTRGGVNTKYIVSREPGMGSNLQC